MGKDRDLLGRLCDSIESTSFGRTSANYLIGGRNEHSNKQKHNSYEAPSTSVPIVVPAGFASPMAARRRLRVCRDLATEGASPKKCKRCCDRALQRARSDPKDARDLMHTI